MQKQIFFPIIVYIIIVLTACNSATEEFPDNKIALRSELDTFYAGNHFYRIDTLSATAYPKAPVEDTAETKFLSLDQGLVQRRNDTLLFITDKQQPTLLINDNSKDGYTNYRYLGFQPMLNQYIVFASLYESYQYLLISRKTGDTTFTCGMPAVSPDKKYFICGNADLVAGFTFNGIEFYKNEVKPKLLYSKGLTKWGPKSIQWINDSTLFMKAVMADTLLSTDEKISYLRLTLHQ